MHTSNSGDSGAGIGDSPAEEVVGGRERAMLRKTEDGESIKQGGGLSLIHI